MGALAPLHHWIPEDDLLLKNAIEAGASLECLAKGAVQFSRRFTFQELQDRWYSILYSESVAAKVAEQIAGLDHSVPKISRNSKSSNFRVQEVAKTKRHVDSVRKIYYSKRKKCRNGTNNSFDLNFLVVHSAHMYCHGEVEGHLVAPVSRDFGLPDAGFDARCLHFCQDNITCVDDGISNRIIDGGCLYGFTEDSPPGPVDNGVGHSLASALKPESLHDKVPQSLGKNLNMFSNCSGGQEIGQPVILHVSGTFDDQDDDLRLSFSSPLPCLPVWKTFEELTVPVMSSEANFEGREENVTPGGDEVEQDLPPVQAMGRKRSIVSEQDLMELSSSLLDLSSEEEDLFNISEVGKGSVIDHSCPDRLGSVLLNSPGSDSKRSTGTNSCLVIQEVASPGYFDSSGEPVPLSSSDTVSGCHSELDGTVTFPPKQTSPRFPEPFFCCELNTEDPDVPSNNDIFPPTGSDEAVTFIAKIGELHDELEVKFREISCVDEENESFISNIDCLSEGESKNLHGLSSNAVSHPYNSLVSENVTKELNMMPSSLVVLSKVDMQKSSNLKSHTDTLAQPNFEPSPTGGYATGVYECEAAVLEKTSSSHPEVFSKEQQDIQPLVNLDTSYQEELHPESDDDIPYFSDVEAMILDMDLDPYDEESYLARAVTRYQFEATKKTIIRLEQGARACMQRAIASHKALAVFYGRHLKHYIRKPEVSIGRATEDINVDIDLGKEGRANKVSRRQCIIKMEEDGSFYLTNIGKYSLLVNGREVIKGQRATLSSACLIEIRGMRFIFETNCSSIMPYAANTALKKRYHVQTGRYGFHPDESA